MDNRHQKLPGDERERQRDLAAFKRVQRVILAACLLITGSGVGAAYWFLEPGPASLAGFVWSVLWLGSYADSCCDFAQEDLRALGRRLVDRRSGVAGSERRDGVDA